MNYLTCRSQYVQIQNCVSSKILCSTGAPQGTFLSPFLFTLHTFDFRYNSDSCFLQKYSDDSVVVSCIRGGREKEYRDMIKDFTDWCNLNHFLLNTSKTKGMMIDLKRKKSTLEPVTTDMEVQLNDKLDRSRHKQAVHKKGQSRLYFL